MKGESLFRLGVWASDSLFWKSKEDPKMATKVTDLMSLNAGTRAQSHLLPWFSSAFM